MTNNQLKLVYIPHKCMSSGGINYKIREKEDVIEIHSLHAIYYLKDVEKDIWNKIDGKRTIEKIINMLINEYEGDEEIIMKEVLDFIDNLKAKNLVTIV